MEASARNSYLETEVLTATPQRLQLMLIEAAIRFVQRARAHWRADENEKVAEALIRAQTIMTELLGSLNKEVDPELTKKTAAVYLFVFRSLIEAGHHHDEEKLEDALKVLQMERETWSELCRKLGSSKEATDSFSSGADHSSQVPPSPYPSTDSGMPGEASAGFSLEA